ncbi:MAG: hypothetical protein C5B43_01650 [Verrucomicrobia bacterium]|nr:MAG: hypothetical protein C5B43_01650 [Verrucomicrobiota bacterium]
MNASTVKKKSEIISNPSLDEKKRIEPRQVVSVPNNEKALLERQVDLPQDKIPTRRKHWESTHKPVEINGSDKKNLSERAASVVLSSFSEDQLPLTDEHHIYFKGNDGSLTLKKNEHYEGGINMTVYGVDTKHTPQYVTEQLPSPNKKGLHHLEAFATANKKGIKKTLRNTYPIETYQECKGFPQDRGHGIDFILTTPEKGNSSIDSSNYTLQNSVYNRQIRNLLVGSLIGEPGISYKEINIYSDSPPQLRQKIGAGYTISKQKESPLIDVPEGFLFFVYDASKKIKKLYYFPNFIDYKTLKEREGISYKDVPEIFEMMPIHKVAGNEINLLEVPIYDENKSDEEIEKEINQKFHIWFRFDIGSSTIVFKQCDKADVWIPREARNALKKTLAIKQLKEMAESEFNSIYLRLAFIEIMLDETDFTPIVWLKRVEQQIAIQSTLEEKLELHDTYVLIKNKYQNIYNDLSINNKEQSLLIEILNQFGKEKSSIREKLRIAHKIDDPIERQFYFDAIEQHIMNDLEKTDAQENIIAIAIEELHNLADYYSGLYYSKERYGIPDPCRKAHDLYQILLKRFENVIDWDVAFHANLFQELFDKSPKSASIEHMNTYFHFFECKGFEEHANFWNTKLQEYNAQEEICRTQFQKHLMKAS